MATNQEVRNQNELTKGAKLYKDAVVGSVKAFKEMGQDTKKMLSTFDSITDSISEIATSFDDIGDSTFLIMDNTKTLQKQIAKVAKTNKDQATVLNSHLKAYQGALSTAKKLDAQAKLLLGPLEKAKGFMEGMFGQTLSEALGLGNIFDDLNDTIKDAFLNLDYVENLRKGIEDTIDGATSAFQEMGGVKMDGMEEAAEAAEEVSKSTMTSYDAIGNGNRVANEQARKLAEGADGAGDIADAAAAGKLQMLALGAAALATVAYFASIVKGAIELRKELGLSVIEASKLTKQSQILSFQFALLGVSGDEIKSAQIAIREELGGTVDGSRQFLSNLINTSAQIGMSASDLIVMRENMRAIGGFSQDQADALIMSTRELATQKNVIPSKVFADVTEDAEFFANYAKDGGKNLLDAAVAARQLGSNLAITAKVADSLLDFESSVNAEMEASVLLGRDLNLDMARRAVLNSDMLTVQKEVLRVVGSMAEFDRLNVIEKQKLAAAVGLSTSELLTQVKAAERKKILDDDSLTTQQKLESGLVGISDLIGKGINQFMATFGDSLAGIGTTLISVIMPALGTIFTVIGAILIPVAGIAEAFNMVNDYLGGALGSIVGIGAAMYGLVTVYKTLKGIAAVTAVFDIFRNAFTKGGHPVLALSLATASIIGMMSMAKKVMNVGDMQMSGGGATIMTSGTSGGIFNTRADDEVNVGPKGFMAQAVTNGMLQVASMQQQGSSEVAQAFNRFESGQKQRHLEAQTSRGVLTDQTKRNRPGEVVIT